MIGERAAPVFSAGLIVQTAFEDIDLLDAASWKWRNVYVPLGRGPFRCEITGVHTARAQIGAIGSSQGFAVRGFVPQHTHTVTVYESSGGRLIFRSRALNPELEGAYATSASEYDFVSEGPTSQLLLSVDTGLFERILSDVWGEKPPNANVIRFKDAGAKQTFCTAARALIERGIADPEVLLGDAGSAHEEYLVRTLFENTVPGDERPPLMERHRVARKAFSYIFSRMKDPPTLSEICNAVTAHERTLLVGFHETYGESPHAYLRNMRLLEARRELRRMTDHPGAVSKVATEWGFFHFGRFSRDYKRLFGEAPSRTLALAAEK